MPVRHTHLIGANNRIVACSMRYCERIGGVPSDTQVVTAVFDLSKPAFRVKNFGIFGTGHEREVSVFRQVFDVPIHLRHDDVIEIQSTFTMTGDAAVPRSVTATKMSWLRRLLGARA